MYVEAAWKPEVLPLFHRARTESRLRKRRLRSGRFTKKVWCAQINKHGTGVPQALVQHMFVQQLHEKQQNRNIVQFVQKVWQIFKHHFLTYVCCKVRNKFYVKGRGSRAYPTYYCMRGPTCQLWKSTGNVLREVLKKLRLMDMKFPHVVMHCIDLLREIES